MSLPSGLIDVEHSLAGDTPVAQLGADFCYVTPTVFGKDRFQRAVADKCSQQRQIGREPVLVLGGEIRETLDAGIGVLGEVAEAQWCGLAGRIAKDDDRSPRLDSRNSGGKRSATGGFEDQREPALRPVDAFDDFGRTPDMLPALRPTDDGCNAGP